MPHHHYKEQEAFEEEYQLDDKIVSKILDQTPGGRVKGNPTIFRRKTTQYYLLPKQSTVLVVPLKNQLQMLELEEDKVAKIFKIFDRGELFIGYHEANDEVSFIENLPAKTGKGKCNLVTTSLD